MGPLLDLLGLEARGGHRRISPELTGPEFEVCELSGLSGTYALTDLPAGEYKVGFFPESLLEEEGESSPFVPQYWNDKPSWESADILTLGLGANAGGIDASLVSSSTPPTQRTEQPPETQRSPRTVTPDPVVTIPPQSIAPKHCPAGRGAGISMARATAGGRAKEGTAGTDIGDVHGHVLDRGRRRPLYGSSTAINRGTAW